MKTTILTIIICAFSWGAFAQCTGSGGDKYAVSFYTSLNFSKGVEVRGEFETWYLAFQAENFIKEEKFFLNWGFGLGLLKETYQFQYSGGIRVGFIHIQGVKKPAFGLEAEIDYLINDAVFIGVRAAYDVYIDSPSVEQPNSESLARGFIKIGYKF